MRKSLSQKELGFISILELRKKYFFTRADIRSHFRSDNDMGVYLHRLKKKGRIVKINLSKYYLVPIRAVGSRWSEHPFIIIDEMMNGKDYCIGGKAAAYYWKLIDQLPYEYEVFSMRIQAIRKIFNTIINIKRVRKLPGHFTTRIKNHSFRIATKETSKRWI